MVFLKYPQGLWILVTNIGHIVFRCFSWTAKITHFTQTKDLLKYHLLHKSPLFFIPFEPLSLVNFRLTYREDFTYYGRTQPGHK